MKEKVNDMKTKSQKMLREILTLLRSRKWLDRWKVKKGNSQVKRESK